MRSVTEIIAAEKEMFDKVWYGRPEKNPAAARPQLDNNLVEQIVAAQKRVEDAYGYDEVQPGDQFDGVFCPQDYRPCGGFLGMNGTISIPKRPLVRCGHVSCPSGHGPLSPGYWLKCPTEGSASNHPSQASGWAMISAKLSSGDSHG